MNEKVLIKKCQRGDRQAFDELIRLYYDYVSGFLLKTTTDEILSEDLTQETFLKMIRNIDLDNKQGLQETAKHILPETAEHILLLRFYNCQVFVRSCETLGSLSASVLYFC